MSADKMTGKKYHYLTTFRPRFQFWDGGAGMGKQRVTLAMLARTPQSGPMLYEEAEAKILEEEYEEPEIYV